MTTTKISEIENRIKTLKGVISSNRDFSHIYEPHDPEFSADEAEKSRRSLIRELAEKEIKSLEPKIDSLKREELERAGKELFKKLSPVIEIFIEEKSWSTHNTESRYSIKTDSENFQKMESMSLYDGSSGIDEDTLEPLLPLLSAWKGGLKLWTDGENHFPQLPEFLKEDWEKFLEKEEVGELKCFLYLLQGAEMS